jgi:hypothetical protein
MADIPQSPLPSHLHRINEVKKADFNLEKNPVDDDAFIKELSAVIEEVWDKDEPGTKIAENADKLRANSSNSLQHFLTKIEEVDIEPLSDLLK